MEWTKPAFGALIGVVTGTLFGLLAFHFLTPAQYPAMGQTLFVLTPTVAGFSIAMVTKRWDGMVAAGMISVVITLLVLVAFGKEGPLCALMAFPIIFGCLSLGVLIGVAARKIFAILRQEWSGPKSLLLLIGPLAIFIGERVETPRMHDPRTEVVENAVTVNEPPERVWSQILSIDSIEVSKPMLMYVGLPIPQRCTMEGRGVGAKRTCYFNVGYIEETVTKWNPPNELGLSIDRTHMPGRHWLGFESAEYRLEAQGSATLLTRRTTVFSYLHPAWYWRGLERMGVEEEHDYILRDVAARAGR